MGVVTRLAPTPSGYLHLGNVFSFILTWLYARKLGGRVYLRIDDMDTSRVRPEYVDDILQTLDWLGLDWDSPPFSPGEMNDYRHYQWEKLLRDLPKHGHFLYGCECTRSDVRNFQRLHPGFRGGDYPLVCREKKLSPQNSRFNVRYAIQPGEVLEFQNCQGGKTSYNFREGEDFIVRQKGGKFAYQWCSWCDDNLWEVNTIIRGRDLIPSTAYQALLARNFPGSAYLRVKYLFHPHILDPQGIKLSKSTQKNGLPLKKQFPRSEIVLTLAANWMGLKHLKPRSASDLLKDFSPLGVAELITTLRDVNINLN